MAWEWSYTDKAIFDAEQYFMKMTDKDKHRVIATEWMVWLLNEKQDGASSIDFTAMEMVFDDDPNEYDLEWCWEKAEENRTCDNGGFDLWVCPYGCHGVNLDSAERFVDNLSN